MFDFYTVRGVRYGVNMVGEGRPLLLLHGFTGSSQNWLPLLRQLTTNHQVIAPDLLGHGQTEATKEIARYKMEEAGHDLHNLLCQLDVSQIDLVGYSMGGRLALYFASKYPELVRTLTLESGSPGLATAEARQERKGRDDLLAKRIEKEGIDLFVDFWEGLGLWESQKQLTAEVRHRLREQRLANRPLGLANSLRGMGTGVQPNLWPDLATLPMPVQLLTGEFDHKFINIAQEMVTALKHGHHHTIRSAGHTTHLEQGAQWATAVLAFTKG